MPVVDVDVVVVVVVAAAAAGGGRGVRHLQTTNYLFLHSKISNKEERE